MSFWGKLAGIGMMGAGVYTGQPALIAGGASVFTGDMAAEASKDAAQTQIESADKALAMNQRMYDDTNQRQAAIYADNRALFTPFVNLGTSGAGALGNLLNLPPSNAMSASPPAGAMPQPLGAGTLGDPTMAPKIGASTAQQAALQASQSSIVPESKRGGPLRGDKEMEVLQAPDGSFRAVPAARVDWYLSRGAKRTTQEGAAS